MIVPVERKYLPNIKRIIRPIVEKLVTEHGMTKSTATDFIYNSETFILLSDESTALCQKSWTEIYKLLLQELNLKK
jgi:hypothetical protein